MTDHIQAISAVNKTLAFLKRSIAGNQNQYTTYPALVVYDPTLSCPEGGELAVAVVTPGKLSSVTDIAEQLRSRLQQSSLSVVGAPEEGAATTKSLIMEVKGDLATIARIWQTKATEIKNATISGANKCGIYVSVGILDKGNGNVVIQGEANPRYFPTEEDKSAWKKAATKVASAVVAELHQQIEPEFKDLGFKYLRAKDKPNSRGENF